MLRQILDIILGFISIYFLLKVFYEKDRITKIEYMLEICIALLILVAWR